MAPADAKQISLVIKKLGGCSKTHTNTHTNSTNAPHSHSYSHILISTNIDRNTLAHRERDKSVEYWHSQATVMKLIAKIRRKKVASS